MRLITNVNPPIKSNRNYFRRLAKSNLGLKKSMKKPCNDCAITYGFYTPIANELLDETEVLQDEVLNNWFCHNNPNECCKGALNYIKSMRIRRSKE